LAEHPPQWGDGKDFNGIAVIAHVVTGNAAAYMEWRKGLSPQHEEPNRGGNIDELWPAVAAYHKTKGESDDAERLAMIQSIWELAALANSEVGSGHFQEGIKEICPSCRVAKMGLDAIKEAGLISSEEIATVGPALAAANDVYGEIWRQVAHEQLSLQQFEQAADCLQKAVDQAKPEMDQAIANRTVELAFALQQAGRIDQAKSKLEGLDSQLLLGDNVARFENLKKSLGQSP
jgi:tetratricopeptide (TPR) repeat protein